MPTPGETITKWFQDEGHAYYDELAEKIDTDLLIIRSRNAALEAENAKLQSGLRHQMLLEFMAGEDTAIQIFKRFEEIETELATAKQDAAELAKVLESMVDGCTEKRVIHDPHPVTVLLKSRPSDGVIMNARAALAKHAKYL